jgi:hypothetical protein
VWWTLFAAAFGVTEAVVAFYIRRTTGMDYGLSYPEIWARRGLIFDSASVEAELRRQGIWTVEQVREVATLLLLAGAAGAASRTWRERLGLFLFTFAVWDLVYYASLPALIGFPRSLAQTDIYFLVPIAWYGPVWFPVLVVMPALLVFSLWLLLRAKPATR